MSKSCHANMQKPCKHAKTMQKPCKNHAKTMQHAARTLASTLRKNVQAVRVMQKTSCSTCHKKNRAQNRAKKRASCSCHAKNKLFHMSCKNHAKTMQTCKNHATCGAYAGVYAGRRGTAAWRVRYSTYSTYSKDAGGRVGVQRLGFNAGQVARQELNTSGTCVEPLSFEGFFQMACILPEASSTRPAFHLVLRRIRSLKRCVA